MSIAQWASAVCISVAASVGSAQVIQKLANPMPDCPPGQSSVTMTFTGVDLHVTGGGVTLKCNTTIIVTGGDIYIDAPIYGMTPHSNPRPQGQDGYKSFNLTLITRCGPRLATPGPDNSVPALARGYCGSINLLAPVDLHGEYGVDGQAGESAGDGYAGGHGGDGGDFTADSIKDINAYSIIDTSGGNGGNGGPGGSETGCEAHGNAFGGWGAAGGNAGFVTLRHATAAPNNATIRVGSGQYTYISAVGGSSGNGGAGNPGEQHGCGATAGSGGSAADGGSGGTVLITGLRIESSASTNDRVAYTNGGAGGTAGPGGQGGSCLPGLLPVECGPPVNGGAAGNAGMGGKGGPITVSAYGTPLSISDPGPLSGSFSCDASGGQGGGGASGGNGGAYDCDQVCCGSGGFSQAGDSGGNGGLVNVSGTRVNLSALVYSRGGAGGSGTHGSCGGCGPCDCEQGGLGGAGGAGGNLVTQGNNPFGSWVSYDLTGGCGGAGGTGGPGAPCAPGGLHGNMGTFSDGLVPVSTSTNIGTPCEGSHGPGGNGMTCEGGPVPCF